MIERFPFRRTSAAIVRARRAPMLEPLERRHLMAGWSPVGPETLVNDTTAGIQETTFESDKSIASDDNGRFVVVWSGSGAGDADGVYARLYDATGPLGASFRVNTTTAGVQTEAAVAMDNSGRFVVVWSSIGQDGSGWGVYGQRYNAAGSATGSQFRINTTTAGDQNQPSVAMDMDGDFVVTWTSANTDPDGLGIAGQRFNSSGLAQGGEIDVNSYTDGNQVLSAVAIADAGNFTVVWQSDFTDTGSIGIFTQRFTAVGAPSGPLDVVNTTTVGFQLAPAIGMNASGAYVVAWMSDSQDGSGRGIFAQRYTSLGAKTGPEFGVNATTAGDQQYPSVAVDNSGAFVIAWESAAQDASGFGAYAREYTATGVSIGAEFRLNTTTAGDQHEVFVSPVGGGDYVAVWSGNGAGDDSGIFLQRYEDLAAGVTVNPTSGLVTTEAGGAATFTVVLDSRPTANVTISVTSGDLTEGTVSTALLAFTRNNWNVAQTVTVTGVNDALNDGNVAYTITTGAATSTDADYSGRAVADVSATNIDTTPPPNAPPTVSTSGAALQYVENSGPVVVDAGLTVADANDVTLTSAVVSIVGYVSGQDLLDYVSGGAITGSWNATTGTLTLSAVATVAQYQAALRAVTYSNTSDNPGTAGRSVRFVVNDGQANSSPASRAVAVNAVNDPPVAGDDTYAGEQGVVLSVPAGSGVLRNDTDVDGGALSAVLVQQAANGTVQVFTNGSFTYTPNAGFWGTDSFVYSANDGAGGSDTATVTIQVARAAGVTVTPTSGLITTETGGWDTFSVVLDRAPTADVTINLSSSDPTEGAVSVGSVTFTPANWNVPQVVTVTGVSDGVNGAVAYSVVTSAAASADGRYGGLAVADVSVVNVPSGSTGGGGLRGTYFDNPNFTGTRVSRLDPVINFNWANGSPDAAIAPDTFSARWTGEIQPQFGETYTFYTTSADGVRLRVNGVLLVNNWTNHPETVNSATISLAAGQWYTIVMEMYENTGVAVSRLEWSSASQAREVVPPTRLRPANVAAVAGADAYSVISGTTLADGAPGVLANDDDADLDPLSATLVSGPAHGVLTFNADGSFGYTPAAGYVGPDSFVYSIDDGWGGTSSAAVSINVTPAPGIVVSPTSGLTTTEAGGAASFTVVLTRQPTAPVRIDLAPSFAGEGSLSATSLVFDASNWNVAQSVTVTGVDDGVNDADRTYAVVLAPAVSADPLYDGFDASDVAVTNVANVPPPAGPVAVADGYRFVGGNVLAVGPAGVLGNDTSPGGLALSASLVQPAAHGVVSLAPDGGFVYTPAAGFAGTDRFTYLASDANGVAPGEVTIVVEPAPDPGPGPQPQPQDKEPPVVVPVPRPPLSTPGIGNEGDEAPVEHEDPPVIVVTAPPPMPPPPELAPTLAGASPEARPAQPGGPVAPAPVALAPPPMRLLQRQAVKARREEGSEQPDEVRDDDDAGRAPAVRGTFKAPVAVVNALPAAAMVTAVGPLATKLDAMARQLGAADNQHKVTVRTVGQVAMAMTAGYVMWSLRGASLLASLVTSLPLWRSLDPLPILEARVDRDRAKAEAKRRKKAKRKSGRGEPGDPNDPDGKGNADDKLGSIIN